MIGIHSIHRRMAEIVAIAISQFGGSIKELPECLKTELDMCLKANMNIVVEYDQLKNMSMLAYSMGDVDWQHEVCAKIEKMEEKFV